MDTSLSWIKAYVPDLDVTAQEYTDAMTLSGTKVEGFEKMDADLDRIVVGQIDKIEKHPDADKLIICQVNIGTETIQIVTGAPNVKEGDKVPVVLDGGRVAGGHEPGQRVAGGIKIKKGKLRGVPSNGMMCSIEELGSNRDMYPEAPEYGIYIFQKDVEVGSSAISALGPVSYTHLDVYKRQEEDWTGGVLTLLADDVRLKNGHLSAEPLNPDEEIRVESIERGRGIPSYQGKIEVW